MRGGLLVGLGAPTRFPPPEHTLLERTCLWCPAAYRPCRSLPSMVIIQQPSRRASLLHILVRTIRTSSSRTRLACALALESRRLFSCPIAFSPSLAEARSHRFTWCKLIQASREKNQSCVSTPLFSIRCRHTRIICTAESGVHECTHLSTLTRFVHFTKVLGTLVSWSALAFVEICP